MQKNNRLQFLDACYSPGAVLNIPVYWLMQSLQQSYEVSIHLKKKIAHEKAGPERSHLYPSFQRWWWNSWASRAMPALHHRNPTESRVQRISTQLTLNWWEGLRQQPKAETALRRTSTQLEASRLPCEDIQKNSCVEQPLSRARLSVKLGSTKQDGETFITCHRLL